MIFYHPTILLIKAGSTFFLDQASNHQQADLITYQCLIGKLIYLNCKIYPNIAFVIRQLNCHNSDLRMEYLHIAKQILCYLKRTITLGIEYGNDLASYRLSGRYGELKIVVYANSSYVGNLEDGKLITRYYFFFGRAIII